VKKKEDPAQALMSVEIMRKNQDLDLSSRDQGVQTNSMRRP